MPDVPAADCSDLICTEPGGIEIEANSANRVSQQVGRGPQHVKRIVPSSQPDEPAAIRTFRCHIDSIHHHIRVQQMVRLEERFSPVASCALCFTVQRTFFAETTLRRHTTTCRLTVARLCHTDCRRCT